jgi:hypothetical protein
MSVALFIVPRVAVTAFISNTKNAKSYAMHIAPCGRAYRRPYWCPSRQPTLGRKCLKQSVFLAPLRRVHLRLPFAYKMTTCPAHGLAAPKVVPNPSARSGECPSRLRISSLLSTTSRPWLSSPYVTLASSPARSSQAWRSAAVRPAKTGRSSRTCGTEAATRPNRGR